MSGSDSECDAKRDINVKLTNLITKDVKISQFFKALINDLKKNFLDDEAITDIFEHYTGGINMSNFDKLISKNKNKEKKKEEKFVAVGLTKPAANINVFFTNKFKENCQKKGKEYSAKEREEAYNKLTEKEKDKLRQELVALNEEYKVKTEEQRQAAIAAGTEPADKPKRPNTGYLRFSMSVREEVASKFENDKDAFKKISFEIKKRWEALSEKEREKFNSAFKKEMEKYRVEMKKWTDNEAERQKKLGQSSNEEREGEIETTGKADKKQEIKKPEVKKEKSKSKKEESENEESEKSEPSDEEEKEEKEEEKPKKKAETKKTEPKKAKAKKVETESEKSEEEEEEEEVKPKKKGKASKA